jgi:hypothetical protein
MKFWKYRKVPRHGVGPTPFTILCNYGLTCKIALFCVITFISNCESNFKIKFSLGPLVTKKYIKYIYFQLIEHLLVNICFINLQHVSANNSNPQAEHWYKAAVNANNISSSALFGKWDIVKVLSWFIDIDIKQLVKLLVVNIVQYIFLYFRCIQTFKNKIFSSILNGP